MTIDFVLAAIIVFVASVCTVRSSKLVHAVLWLGIMLGSTAVLFIQLDAPFLAAIQLLLYVGGVMILMIFGVMLTRRAGDGELKVASASPVRGGAVALALFGILALAIQRSTALAGVARPTGDTAGLGRALLGDRILAFEVLSALLLAAMVGALVIARRRDPGVLAGETAAEGRDAQ